MSVSIKVSIRCRPFTIDDKLGVILKQNSEEEGDVELINAKYATLRFPFTYCWWSAYGYKRHILPIGPDGKSADSTDLQAADSMKLTDQEMAYNDVGQKVKADLLGGNAVVLFAYGLSGSGKTYTVFGPDATDAPEAWFKHATPQPLWGLYPRLAYELFQEAQPEWKIRMKYFQNVVDIVRDLMSDDAAEQHYKNGMRKDPDGFMDIEWCKDKVLTSWEDLRKTFQVCNARKAIAPTQFNPMSTRGHCIMVLEVEMPKVTGKLRGRLYVCDLAGTEPAGDIVYARYEKKNFDDGTFEHKFLGAHDDIKKTKELQDQGKKINLSLSEMAQFFMKMAEAVKANKLKAGMSIPGCNSFFLCKYLKDTMLQARTYLFCAIRPEVTYLKYTFATLGFATNASVVKLSPRKVTVAASAAERALQEQLDVLQAEKDALDAKDVQYSKRIAELEKMYAEKEGGGSGGTTSAEDAQKAEYASRGISLTSAEEDNTLPFFSNLDEDEFRSNRLMYILKKEVTVFGPKGDVSPMSFAILKNHCSVKFVSDKVSITPGKGDVWVNGKRIAEGTEKALALFDRVAVGDQLLMFKHPGQMEGAGEPMSGEDAVEEFQKGILAERNSGGGNGGSNGDMDAALAAERAKFQEEREKWEKESGSIKGNKSASEKEEHDRQMAVIDNSILDLLPKTKEAKQLVDCFNRVQMSFDVILEKGEHVPRVKISVTNAKPKYSILLDPQDFLQKLGLLKDESMKLKSAIDSDREYFLPSMHDPLNLMFDNDFHLGTATHWPEYTLYNLVTDDDEKFQDVKNAAVPYNNIGLLGVTWTPLAGPNPEDWGKDPADIEDETDLIGKPWTFRVNIDKADNLPVLCNMSYISYDFFGEEFTTEAVQQTTYSPVYGYSMVHHIPSVTQEFIDYLKGPFEMQIHISQHVDVPPDVIGTSNAIVTECIKLGDPEPAYRQSDAARPKSEAEIRCQKLEVELSKAQAEIKSLTAQIVELKDHHEPAHDVVRGLKTSKSVSGKLVVD